MNERLRIAYHEAGHALVARALGRRVDSVSLAPDSGGAMRGEPLAEDATDEERERWLIFVFAGQEAERYAPTGPEPTRNGDDPWFSDGEIAAMAAVADAVEGSGEGTPSAPSDEDVIAHYSERLGEEAIERARAHAAELVHRQWASGRLEHLADELLWRSHLTGEEIERVLAGNVWRRGAFAPLT